MAAPLGELLTAMVTPFQADGSVNFASARRLAHHLIDTGSDGIVVCGTTGEGPTISDREKLDLLEVITAEVGSTATVIANTGTYDTHHSVALTRAALESGAVKPNATFPVQTETQLEGVKLQNAHGEACGATGTASTADTRKAVPASRKVGPRNRSGRTSCPADAEKGRSPSSMHSRARSVKRSVARSLATRGRSGLSSFATMAPGQIHLSIPTREATTWSSAPRRGR